MELAKKRLPRSRLASGLKLLYSLIFLSFVLNHGCEMNPKFSELTEKDLEKVKIFYVRQSGKPGGGKMEVTILGSGLYISKHYQQAHEPPIVREKTISAAEVKSLLQIFEQEHFFSLKNHYPADHTFDFGRRILELKLPHREKRVVVDRPGVLEFERIVDSLWQHLKLAELS